MARQRTRRQVLAASATATAVGLAGCRGSSEADTTPTAAGPDAASFDFEEPRDALTDAGWRLGQSVARSNSHLRGTDRETATNDYAMYPSPAVGTWSFGGVVNDEQFYGLQFILSPAAVETTDVDALGAVEGYSLLVRQQRYGGLAFRKLTSDGATRLHEAEFESTGDPNDYELSLPEPGRFRLSMNGSELATVTDDTFEINSLVVRFDAAGQRVDSVAYSP